MEIKEFELPGCYLLTPRVFTDHRGGFVKVFNESIFDGLGLEFDVKEEFYSWSNKSVIRGMHFQLPPMDHEKLVYCLSGEVLDVFVDLRIDSPSFGKFSSCILSVSEPRFLYLPKGIAHGFLAQSDNALMVYKTSTEHSPENDAGIRWDSFGFDWPVSDPILSDRDKNFPKLEEFKSPF